MIVWLAGAMLLLVRLLLGDRQIRRLLSGGQPVVRESLDESLGIVAATLGVSRLPPIIASPTVACPVVAGLMRPIVVLPIEFVKSAEPAQLTDVLIHECAHVLRRDTWIGLAQRLVQLAFWPHPLIYVMNRSLSRAREEVCDNYVLRRGDAVGYAQTLLELAERYRARSVPAAALAIFSPRWKLEDRVAGLLNPQRHHETRVGRAKFAVLAALVVAGGSALAAGRFDDPRPKAEAATYDVAIATAAETEQADSIGQTVNSNAPVNNAVVPQGSADAAELGLEAVLEAYEKGAALIQSYDITYHADETRLLVEQVDPEELKARSEAKQRVRLDEKPREPRPIHGLLTESISPSFVSTGQFARTASGFKTRKLAQIFASSSWIQPAGIAASWNWKANNSRCCRAWTGVERSDAVDCVNRLP
jgi:hypothetical protein